MQAEEVRPSLLVGRHVVEVGRRQVWPFLTFADAETAREVRVYVDAAIAVEPTPGGTLHQGDAEVVPALEGLLGLTVTVARAGEEGLVLGFGDATLRVSNEPNAVTTGSPWWVGPT